MATMTDRQLAIPARMPAATQLIGRLVTLGPLDPAGHAGPLFRAVHGHDELYDYLFDMPAADEAAMQASLSAKVAKTDALFFAIVDNRSQLPIGIASYLRIEPVHRVIEVGNILFTPLLQRTPHATEAMYLMAKHAFEELGYRRYEWKCNALNGPSRNAALRLGFSFEGIFRQHMIVKGASRDTAWFAMLDSEWPRCRQAFDAWLDPSNFRADGSQIQTLADLRELVL